MSKHSIQEISDANLMQDKFAL